MLFWCLMTGYYHSFYYLFISLPSLQFRFVWGLRSGEHRLLKMNCGRASILLRHSSGYLFSKDLRDNIVLGILKKKSLSWGLDCGYDCRQSHLLARIKQLCAVNHKVITNEVTNLALQSSICNEIWSCKDFCYLSHAISNPLKRLREIRGLFKFPTGN